MSEFPMVTGRAMFGGRAAVWVKLGPEPDDVIHIDLKRGEHMTDAEAIEAAEFLRAVGKLKSG